MWTGCGPGVGRVWTDVEGMWAGCGGGDVGRLWWTGCGPGVEELWARCGVDVGRVWRGCGPGVDLE